MRTATAIFATLGIALVLPAILLPASQAASSCGQSKLLAKTSQVTVYRRGGRVVACDRQSGRILRLPDAQPDFFRPIAQGHMVAYQSRFGDAETITLISVFDVRKRKSLIAADTYTESTNPHLEVDEPVTGLDLTANGTITWIARRPDGVREVRTDSPTTLDISTLDESPDINPSSLAVTRRYIYWQVAGVAKFAPTLRDRR